jgi:ABC-type lipoprotein export system ATPase subunit
MVMGKTGAGKTTAINMFLNLAMNLKYYDKRLITITQMMKFQNQEPIVLDCNLPEFKDKESDILDRHDQAKIKDANM